MSFAVLVVFIPCIVFAETYNNFTYYKYNDRVSLESYNDESATSVTVPATIDGLPVSIGYYLFSGFKNLEYVKLSNGITEVGNRMFENCTALKAVDIPNSVTSIDIAAFYCCTSLSNIDIPSSVTSIGSNAFVGCTALKKIILPNVEASNFDNLAGAFMSCTALEKITIIGSDGSYCSDNGVLFDNDMRLVAYPAGKSDTYYNIPNDTTTVGWGAFYNCNNLKAIYIPKSVKDISSYAFSGCTKLSDIYYGGSEEDYSSINISNNMSGYNETAGGYYPNYSKDGNNPLLNATIHYNSAPIENNPQITSATATKSGSTYAFSVGLSDVAADCQLVTALYSGGEMVGVKSTQLSEGDTSKSVSITTNNATSAKVFIWDSLTGMRPLCDAKIVTIQ